MTSVPTSVGDNLKMPLSKKKKKKSREGNSGGGMRGRTQVLAGKGGFA